jgi:hypothetical protein
MTPAGFLMMLLSNSIVLLLTAFCFYRVLKTPDVEKHEHAVLEIDTRDSDHHSGR